MIVCSCNVLSDHQIREHLGGLEKPTVGAIFRRVGCQPQCGRCAGNIAALVSEHRASGAGDCRGECDARLTDDVAA